MKYQYVKGRIEEAIDELCVGAGDARKRLISVNDATLGLLDIHFPEQLLGDWKCIQERMTAYGPKTNFKGQMTWDGGAVAHTMERIKNKTASKIAEDILALHKNLQANF